MNETHTLDNLGDVPRDDRAALTKEYAKARIGLLQSEANMNNAAAAFTKTQRKWYGPKTIIDAAASVAAADLGATRINSNITTTQGGVTGGQGHDLGRRRRSRDERLRKFQQRSKFRQQQHR